MDAFPGIQFALISDIEPDHTFLLYVDAVRAFYCSSYDVCIAVFQLCCVFVHNDVRRVSFCAGKSKDQHCPEQYSRDVPAA